LRDINPDEKTFQLWYLILSRSGLSRIFHRSIMPTQPQKDIKMDWRNSLKIIMIYCFVPCASVYALATPLFSLIATTPATLQISTTGAGTVSYLVTNNTQATRTLTLVPLQGVSQGTGGTNPCSSPSFTLQSKQSCLLTLAINGSLIPTSGIHGGPQVCKIKGSGSTDPDPFFCSQASELNTLNVTTVSALTHRVTVGLATNAGLVRVPISYVSEDGGATWSAPATQLGIPAGGTNNSLRAVSCSSSGLICSAVGNTTIAGVQLPLAYNSINGGLSWSAPVLPPRRGVNTSNDLRSVSCSASGLLCTAVGRTINAGSKPLSYYSTDGGASWLAPVALPSPVGTTILLNGVSCSSSGLLCVAVGRTTNVISALLSYTSTDGGQSWWPGVQIPGIGNAFNILTSVSCSSSGLNCSAVGYAIDDNSGAYLAISYTTNNAGITWTGPVFLPTNGTTDNLLNNVICSDSGLLCTAVGAANVNTTLDNLSYTSTDGGNTWSNPVLPQEPNGSTGLLYGVFCDGTGIFCTAVGYNTNDIISYFSTNSGTNWSAPYLLSVQGITVPNLLGVSGNR
jgi:hypothetical protein